MLKDIEQKLNLLSRSELIALNKMVISRIKFFDDLRRLAQNAQYFTGQKVSWNDYDGFVRTGTIIRINRKTVSIQEDNEPQDTWKVSASLLTPLE